MNAQDAAERCYSAVLAELNEAERAAVAETAALLASTADRLAQREQGGEAEGMAVELRRIADEQGRIEELALGDTPRVGDD